MANWQRDLGKEQFWRQMVARQQQSDLTIRAFCEHEGLSQPSFYQWRRELARRDRARPSPRAAIVPVHLVPDATVIEIVLGQGVVVRVPAGADDKTLRQVLAALATSDLATSDLATSDDGTEGASC